MVSVHICVCVCVYRYAKTCLIGKLGGMFKSRVCCFMHYTDHFRSLRIIFCLIRALDLIVGVFTRTEKFRICSDAQIAPVWIRVFSLNSLLFLLVLLKIVICRGMK